MTKLTRAQTELLARAAQAESGEIDGIGDARVRNTLIKHGFLISIPKTDEPSCLLITEAGRSAIGAPAGPAGRARASAKSKPSEAPRATKAAPRKIDRLLELLRREEGATIAAMMAATGWQKHSVRGAIAGAIKKGRGVAVVSENAPSGRIYRVVQA